MIKRFCATFLFVFAFLSAFPQNDGGGVDDEDFHFGFNFQYVSPDYKIYKKEDWRDRYFDPQTNKYVTQSLYSISSPSSPGFGLGFVSNFRLGNNADIRFTPGLTFADKILTYTYKDEAISKVVQSTLADFPLGLKMKSDRQLNFRAYLLLGGKYSYDISSKKKFDDTDKSALDKLVKNNKSIFSYEAGIGFDFYFEFFKLSPELKLSHSIGNVLKREDNAFTNPIDKLFLHNVQFSLYFE